jgi:hypothetical protein
MRRRTERFLISNWSPYGVYKTQFVAISSIVLRPIELVLDLDDHFDFEFQTGSRISRGSVRHAPLSPIILLLYLPSVK